MQACDFSLVSSDATHYSNCTPRVPCQAVYGVLSSIEGLDTFKDVVDKTDIEPWYFSMKKLVQQQQRQEELGKVVSR